MKLLTRPELAMRWGTSERTIDRRRRQGTLTWLDLAGGHGKRPIVRFRLQDIEVYEDQMLQNAK